MNAKLIHPLMGLLLWLVASLPLHAAGLLTPADGSLPPLEIRDHAVKVIIDDGYAVTEVEQVFHNPHGRDLEARYSFPVPEHGAVAEFAYWIDGKPVIGEVLEREQARKVYEEERAAGREAGLTEKDEYRTFEMMVTPVRAGADVRVRLVYLQTARIDHSIGRYVYPLEEGGVDEQKLAFWTANEQVMGRFSFDLELKSGYPVEALRLPAHPQAAVSQRPDGRWNVAIHSGAPPAVAEEGAPAASTAAAQPVYALDKDIVVYWRHAADLPGAVDLVTHKPDANGRGTFLLTVTPGEDLQPIQQGRDWIFVLDVSGSMTGKWATLLEGVGKGLGKLNATDRFRLVLFNSNATELTNGYEEATPEQVSAYINRLRSIQPNQSTNLYAGLQLGLRALDADRTSAIVLVTDGVANVGETEQKRFVELLTKRDVRLFTFIMGNSANRPLLERLTTVSNGFAVSVSNSDDVVGQLLAATSKVNHQALHGVKLKIGGVKVADLTPEEIGSLYRGQQLVVMGHYWGGGEANVELTGRISGQPTSYTARFDFPRRSAANPELERLWAYGRVEELSEAMRELGEDADRRQAVVALGKEYGLVTDYTSMVVVREERFNELGIQRTNRERVAQERQEREQRTAAAPVSRRADAGSPMFSGHRATLGGGALDGWSLLALLVPLMLPIARRSAR